MWTILQQPKPDDYVISTGESHTVREFVEESFRYVGVRIEWEGEGLSEVGVDAGSRNVRVKVSKDYYRPMDVEFLQGNFEKAKRELGWIPRTKFRELVQIMMKEDMARVAAQGGRYSYFV